MWFSGSILKGRSKIKENLTMVLSISVCGILRLLYIFFLLTNFCKQVALTHGPENVKPQVKLTDVDGKFCFEVGFGEFCCYSVLSFECSRQVHLLLVCLFK